MLVGTSLRFCGSLDGLRAVSAKDTGTQNIFSLYLELLRMVVMDYVPDTHLEKAKEDEKPKDLHNQIKAIVHSLHASRGWLCLRRPTSTECRAL
jgi:hypothetical protein